MLKQMLFTFIVCFVVMLPMQAEKIIGGISYTLEMVRYEAFQHVDYQIDMNPYRNYFHDKNKDKNIRALRNNKHKFRDRILTRFEDNEYGVYYPKLKTGFYYSNNGDLIAVSKTLGNNYPRRALKYDVSGRLLTIVVTIKHNENYVFDTNKKLIGHWIGNNGYNEKGELIMTRE